MRRLCMPCMHPRILTGGACVTVTRSSTGLKSLGLPPFLTVHARRSGMSFEQAKTRTLTLT